MTLAAALAEIRRRAPGFAPKIAFIAGSGLGGLGRAMTETMEIAYADLPGFPQPTISGHAGRLLLGKIAGMQACLMLGRVHGYEGAGYGAMATAIRVMKGLGAEALFLTCAAGSLRDDVGPGQLMAISDHINLLGFSPLVGPNDDDVGPRFPDMVNAWDADLRADLRASAIELGVRLEEGVYAAAPGPNFETPAEVRMLARLGADLVGMSTAPECILARHCGLKVVGVACVTNYGAGMAGAERLSHDQTLAAAGAGAVALTELATAFCRRRACGAPIDGMTT